MAMRRVLFLVVTAGLLGLAVVCLSPQESSPDRPAPPQPQGPREPVRPHEVAIVDSLRSPSERGPDPVEVTRVGSTEISVASDPLDYHPEGRVLPRPTTVEDSGSPVEFTVHPSPPRISRGEAISAVYQVRLRPGAPEDVKPGKASFFLRLVGTEAWQELRVANYPSRMSRNQTNDQLDPWGIYITPIYSSRDEPRDGEDTGPQQIHRAQLEVERAAGGH